MQDITLEPSKRPFESSILFTTQMLELFAFTSFSLSTYVIYPYLIVMPQSLAVNLPSLLQGLLLGSIYSGYCNVLH